MSYWTEECQWEKGIAAWRESVALACRWMIDRSLIATPDPGFVGSGFEHRQRFVDWRGAFRGEYAAASGRWDVFCPMWHGGQGVKALALAHAVLGDEEYLTTARLAADFILRHRFSEPGHPEHGLILAYEDAGGGVNTSAILETLDGLFTLSEISKDDRYSRAAISALKWVQRRVFLPDEGLFQDDFDVDRRVAGRARWMRQDRFPQPGRPLLDDGVFLTGHALTGDDSLKDVAVRTANRLLADEDPGGNWKAYPPANPISGVIHPRHAYWWGRPMWMVHKATGESRYLDCCRRSAAWYIRAMRSDGGLFRDTGADFNTPSFGHATSGIACAAILWTDLVREFGDTEWRDSIRKALHFCRSVQFTHAEDPNLQGAILEKVVPPRGTDAPPWYLRDVGTFFYVQAVCRVLKDMPALLE
jgi:hypothetical protein